MKAKILFSLMCILPIAANAAIPYRTELIKSPAPDAPSGHDAEAFARLRRFYVGGAYNFSMWQNYTDDAGVHVSGKNTSSFDAMAGIRLYDIFRLEANYIHAQAKYNAFKLTGDIAMVNAIFDARIDNIYRLFRKQKLVPYVGIGSGISWNSADNAHIDNKITPVAAAMAGVGVELGDRFTLDFGYRYIYMFTPKFDTISDLAPTAHQFRAGARINF